MNDFENMLCELVHARLLNCLGKCVKNIDKEQSQKDLKSIFFNPAELKSILKYYGISKEVLSSPAHRLELEEIAKTCLQTIIDSDFAIVDISNHETIEGRRIKIEIGTPTFVTDALVLIINNDGTYEFEKMSMTLSGLCQTRIENIKITGTENRITLINQLEGSTKQSIVGLNDSGFAIIDVSTNGQNIQKLKLTGNTIQKIGENTDAIFWDGNPLHLNSQSCSNEEITTNNIIATILRNPSSIKFYYDTFGVERIDKILSQVVEK